MKYTLAFLSLCETSLAALLIVSSWHNQHFALFVMLFVLCGANLLLRMREQTVEEQIANAEEKVVKRVLRRLAKCMPGLLDEYFKARAPESAEKLSDVIVAPKQSSLRIPDSLTDADCMAAADSSKS